jgi:DNA-binding PadR family transcriptional regulator
MSLRFVVLGLLVEQPLHGYAIQAMLEERFGELCDPGFGDVYRVLGALVRDGLVTAAPLRVGRRPGRKVHAPTAAGRRALLGWLRAGSGDDARASRDEPFLRIIVADRSAPDLLPALLDADVARRRAAMRDLEERRPPLRRGAGFVALVLGLRHEAACEDARTGLRAAELRRRVLQRQRTGVPVAELLRTLGSGGDGHAASAKPPHGKTGGATG